MITRDLTICWLDKKAQFDSHRTTSSRTRGFESRYEKEAEKREK